MKSVDFITLLIVLGNIVLMILAQSIFIRTDSIMQIFPNSTRLRNLFSLVILGNLV